MSVAASLNILVGMDTSGLKKGAGESTTALSGLDRAAHRVWEGTRTPMEEYETRLGKLAEMVRAGTLDEESFSRAVRQAGIEMGRAKPGDLRGLDRQGLDQYRASLESLSGQLAAGGISQTQFSAAAKEAGQSIKQNAEAHHEESDAAEKYRHREYALDAQLQAGQISWNHYRHELHEAKEEMERAERNAQRLEKGVDVLRAGLGTIGIAVGVEQSFEFLKSSVEAADEANQSYQRLNAVVEATGGAAGYTGREMVELAKGLQQATNYSHLEIESAEAVLTTFQKIEHVNFARATRGVLSMSAVMGTDLRSTAMQVGKALQDPILGLTELRRVGLMLSPAQQSVIRSLVATGDVAAAQGIILKKLTDQYGKSAAAMRSDLKGLEHDWDDLKEAIGKIAQTDFGRTSLQGFARETQDMAKALEELSTAEDGFLNKLKAWRNIANIGLSWTLLTPYAFQGASSQAKVKEGEGPVGATPYAKRRLAAARKREEQNRAEALAQKESAETLDDFNSKLGEEIDLFGLEGHARELAKMEMEGYSQAQLAQARLYVQQIDQMQAAAAAMAEQRKAAKRLAGDIDKLTDSLHLQIAAWGQTAEQARIYDLLERGAKKSEVAEARRAAAELDDLRAAQTIRDDLKLPIQEYQEQIETIMRLKGRGKLTGDEAERAMAKAREQYHAATKKPHGQTAALERGSAEAWHAIVGHGTAAQKTRQQQLAELKAINDNLAGPEKEKLAERVAARKIDLDFRRRDAEAVMTPSDRLKAQARRAQWAATDAARRARPAANAKLTPAQQQAHGRETVKHLREIAKTLYQQGKAQRAAKKPRTIRRIS